MNTSMIMKQAHRMARKANVAGTTYSECLGKAISALYAEIKAATKAAHLAATKKVEMLSRVGINKDAKELALAVISGKFFFVNCADTVINTLAHVVAAQKAHCAGAAEYYSRNAVTMC